MAHKYAEILIALAEGKQVQIRLSGESIRSMDEKDGWQNACPDRVFFYLYGNKAGVEFRVKPETLSINGLEFPRPIGHWEGVHRFYAIYNGKATLHANEDQRTTRDIVEAGLAFATKEGCEAFLAAVKSVLRP